MIRFVNRPPSSSGLGYLVLSQGTGVRVPVGVLQIARIRLGTGRFFDSTYPARKPVSSHDSAMIAIEFYGVPRLRAGTRLMKLEASTVGQALRELGRVCPALKDPVLHSGAVPEFYKLNLNGQRFVSDPETPLEDGDVLLLLSADAGG